MFLGIRQFSSIHLKVVKEKISDFFFFSCIGLTHNPRKNRYKLGKQLTFNMVNSTFFFFYCGQEKKKIYYNIHYVKKNHIINP